MQTAGMFAGGPLVGLHKMIASLIHLRRHLVIIVLIVSGCSRGGSHAQPTGSEQDAAEGPEIVRVGTDYGSNPSDISTDEIYLEYSDGSRVYLTDNNLMDRVPAFSPDNQFVSYLRRRDTNSDGTVNWDDDTELCLFDLQSSTTKQLTAGLSDVGEPTWHPDALRIAFMAGERGRKKLYILDLLTDRRTEVVGEVESWPTWSPDGALIAFYDEQNRVSVVKPDGTERRTLSDDVGNGWALYWTFDNRLVFIHETKGWIPALRRQVRTALNSRTAQSPEHKWQVFSPADQSIKRMERSDLDGILNQDKFGWSRSIR